MWSIRSSRPGLPLPAKYPPRNRSIGGSIARIFGLRPANTIAARDEILVVLEQNPPRRRQCGNDLSLPGVDAIFIRLNDLFWQMKSRMARNLRNLNRCCSEFCRQVKTGTPVGIIASRSRKFSIGPGKAEVSGAWSELKMMVTKAQELVQQLGCP